MSHPHDHLDKLSVFVTVAEQRKINAASKILGLTQPSVSRAIQTLEDTFGARLFVRGRYGARLTPAGELLYGPASRILREIIDINERMKHVGDDLAGDLVVGSYESLAEYLWPDFLIKLRKAYPNLRLSIKTGTRQDAVSRLTSGEVDLLVDAEPRTSEEIMSWKLYSDRFNFYAANRLKVDRVDQARAKSITLLYVPMAHDSSHAAIEDHLRHADYVFEQEYVFDSFATIKRLATRGLGIAVLPTRLAYDDLITGKIRRIPVKGFAEDGFGVHAIFATCASFRAEDPRIRALVTLLRNHFSAKNAVNR